MAIYTKKGDQGLTNLPSAGHLSKGQPIFELLGNLDELNCQIALTLSVIDNKKHQQTIELLKKIQSALMHCGVVISQKEAPISSQVFLQKITSELEEKIDHWEKILPELKNFIIPSGCESSKHSHLCRTLARRSERSLNRCYLGEEQRTLSVFLNRLSDYFFICARYLNSTENYKDEIWRYDDFQVS